MNSLERTLTSIEGTPDRIPFNPFIMHLAAAIDDIAYSKVYCKDAKVLADAQIRFSNSFGTDHVNVSTDAYREASAWGVEVDFAGHTPIAKTHLNLDEFESIEKPDLDSADRVQNRVNAVRILKESVGHEQCVVGWIEAPFAEICCIFGLMNVLKLAREPDWNAIVGGLIDRILPVQKEFAKMQIEAGADIIGAGDSAVSQIGPKRYGEVCLRPTQELFNEIKTQVPVLYHVCGDSSVIDADGRDMLELVADSGASILDIDFQVDMETAKMKIGNRICIRGNTNTTVLGNHMFNSAQVSDAVAKTIQAGKPGGRYMFSAGCEWSWKPLDIAIRNIEIARDLVAKLGVY
ncbi:MAG: uroporphyrinogen decarboxylase family protein [Candidatus Thorarchaeota archaeon]|jgi:uroporphyrinogen-III decarboxylase